MKLSHSAPSTTLPGSFERLKRLRDQIALNCYAENCSNPDLPIYVPELNAQVVSIVGILKAIESLSTHPDLREAEPDEIIEFVVNVLTTDSNLRKEFTSSKKNTTNLGYLIIEEIFKQIDEKEFETSLHQKVSPEMLKNLALITLADYWSRLAIPESDLKAPGSSIHRISNHILYQVRNVLSDESTDPTLIETEAAVVRRRIKFLHLVPFPFDHTKLKFGHMGPKKQTRFTTNPLFTETTEVINTFRGTQRFILERFLEQHVDAIGSVNLDPIFNHFYPGYNS